MNIQQFVPLMKSNDLFKDISSDRLIKLFNDNAYYISSYSKNSVLYFEGEKCMTLDIILVGQVVIQRIDESGNALTIADFHSGDSIGGNLLFCRYPYYPMIIIAKCDTKMLRVKKDLVLELCQSNKAFLYEFLTCISDKTAILTDKIKAISLKSIRSSIIDFLKFEYFSQNNRKIKLTMSKKELAERLGIQRTSLSRELNKMRNDGLIEFDARHITIVDVGCLGINDQIANIDQLY
jgi:CRP-like cAMP-binding protein